MDELNVSHLTLTGYVEMSKYRCLYFSVLFAVYVLIVCSNATIVCLIWTHKNLHQPMYVFIAALLLNCLLFSTTVYPKLLIDFLSETPVVSVSGCLLQFFLFYSIGGTEFWLIASMAFDRYVSICKPLRYPAIMRRSTVKALLILAWLVPACHIAPEAILSAKTRMCRSDLSGIFCNNAVFTLHCTKPRSLTVLGVVALLDLVILPMLFTVFTYTKIFITSRQSGKSFRRKAAETCVPHLMVLISFSYLAAYDVAVARMETDFPKTARLIMTMQIFLYHPLFNPFIYGLKMKEISKHLKLLRITRV